MLITSLALLARSRAWVVFCWVGVAAPAQRRVWGIPPLVAARSQLVVVLDPDVMPRPCTLSTREANAVFRGVYETWQRLLSSCSAGRAAGGSFTPGASPTAGTRSSSVTCWVTARPHCRRVA